MFGMTQLSVPWYLMGSHTWMLRLVQLYWGWLVKMSPDQCFVVPVLLWSVLLSSPQTSVWLVHTLQSNWSRRGNRNHWVFFRCYHTTCAVLQRTVHRACGGLAPILCGTELWRIRTPLWRKLGVSWGISGRCSLDHLWLAVWCHSLPGRRTHTHT